MVPLEALWKWIWANFVPLQENKGGIAKEEIVHEFVSLPEINKPNDKKAAVFTRVFIGRLLLVMFKSSPLCACGFNDQKKSEFCLRKLTKEEQENRPPCPALPDHLRSQLMKEVREEILGRKSAQSLLSLSSSSPNIKRTASMISATSTSSATTSTNTSSVSSSSSSSAASSSSSSTLSSSSTATNLVSPSISSPFSSLNSASISSQPSSPSLRRALSNLTPLSSLSPSSPPPLKRHKTDTAAFLAEKLSVRTEENEDMVESESNAILAEVGSPKSFTKDASSTSLTSSFLQRAGGNSKEFERAVRSEIEHLIAKQISMQRELEQIKRKDRMMQTEITNLKSEVNLLRTQLSVFNGKSQNTLVSATGKSNSNTSNGSTERDDAVVQSSSLSTLTSNLNNSSTLYTASTTPRSVANTSSTSSGTKEKKSTSPPKVTSPIPSPPIVALSSTVQNS